MSSLSKIVFIALAAFGGVAANAHTGVAGAPSGFQAKSVIASHEATPSLSAVVHHVRHRHHRAKHRAHPVRHVR